MFWRKYLALFVIFAASALLLSACKRQETETKTLITRGPFYVLNATVSFQKWDDIVPVTIEELFPLHVGIEYAPYEGSEKSMDVGFSEKILAIKHTDESETTTTLDFRTLDKDECFRDCDILKGVTLFIPDELRREWESQFEETRRAQTVYLNAREMERTRRKEELMNRSRSVIPCLPHKEKCT